MSFLHGTTALGYNKRDKRAGPAGWYSRATRNYLEPIKLLYPVTKKDYSEDEFIDMEWKRLRYWLSQESTCLVTVFGYGAPSTDVEAIKLLNDAWGTGDDRNMEQFEIIDIRSQKEVRKQWDNFIHSHHYDYATDYFKSSLANNPRRTFESYTQHIMFLSVEEAFSESNPVPHDFKTMEELWSWHKELVKAEKENEKQQPA
jgi:hypothetical protein